MEEKKKVWRVRNELEEQYFGKLKVFSSKKKGKLGAHLRLIEFLYKNYLYEEVNIDVIDDFLSGKNEEGSKGEGKFEIPATTRNRVIDMAISFLKETKDRDFELVKTQTNTVRYLRLTFKKIENTLSRQEYIQYISKLYEKGRDLIVEVIGLKDSQYSDQILKKDGALKEYLKKWKTFRNRNLVYEIRDSYRFLKKDPGLKIKKPGFICYHPFNVASPSILLFFDKEGYSKEKKEPFLGVNHDAKISPGDPHYVIYRKEKHQELLTFYADLWEKYRKTAVSEEEMTVMVEGAKEFEQEVIKKEAREKWEIKYGHEGEFDYQLILRTMLLETTRNKLLGSYQRQTIMK